MGIPFHNLTGTPPGSFVVGVGGGVSVRVTKVDDSVFIRVGEIDSVALRLARVLVGVTFVDMLAVSLSI